MQRFAYERPTELRDAIAVLAEHGEMARALSGGTRLKNSRSASIPPAEAPSPTMNGAPMARRDESARAESFMGAPRLER